jgi:GT2 family glycosyltransferase
MPSTIDILIPAVNNSYFTCSLIESIKKHTTIAYQIIYIDNGSDIHELEHVLQSLEGTNNSVIKNAQNLGFVKAINQGLQISTADYICFQNNDTMIFDNCFEKLIEHLKKQNNSGIISPIASQGGGKQGIEIIRSSWNWFDDELKHVDITKYSHDEIDKLLLEKFKGRVVEVNKSLAFFSIVMPRNIFEKVGYLDERYGLGLYDDDDYCQRIVSNGLKLFLALDVYVWHLASTTFKKMYSNSGMMEMLIANKNIFDAKWNTQV